MITSDSVDGWVRLGSKRIDDQLAAVERGTFDFDSLAHLLGPRDGADDGLARQSRENSARLHSDWRKPGHRLSNNVAAKSGRHRLIPYHDRMPVLAKDFDAWLDGTLGANALSRRPR
jgi:hypothetical protein